MDTCVAARFRVKAGAAAIAAERRGLRSSFLRRYFEVNPPFPDAHRENQGTHHTAQPQQTTPGSQHQKVDRGKEKRKREEKKREEREIK